MENRNSFYNSPNLPIISLILFFFLLGLSLYFFGHLLIPFIFGAVIAYALTPGVNRLIKWKMPRIIATGIMVLFFFLSLILLLFVALPFLKTELVKLAEGLPDYVERGQKVIQPLLDFISRNQQVVNIQDKLSDHLGDLVNRVIALVINILTGGMVVANILSAVVITPIISFYLLKDWDNFLQSTLNLLPKKSQSIAIELAKNIDKTLGGYFRGQLMVCLILGLYYIIALSFLKLDYAITIGLLTGFLVFIPYVGFLTSLTVALSLSFAQFGDWTPILLVASVYALGQTLETTFLSPFFIGDRVGLHPVWMILALLVGGATLGFIGILFSIPIAAVLGVFMRTILSHYRNSVFYRSI